ncbi:hypothetical protein, partial [Serratia marcescens]|uniref:hypothetical protein n=1 Tax=Serratia marcescens TaxID=615 RepID=UPI001954B8BC
VWARSHDEARIVWQQACLDDHFDAIPDGDVYLTVETAPMTTASAGRRKPEPPRRSGYYSTCSASRSSPSLSPRSSAPAA